MLSPWPFVHAPTTLNDTQGYPPAPFIWVGLRKVSLFPLQLLTAWQCHGREGSGSRKLCPAGSATPLLQTLPGPGVAEAPWETLKLLTISWGQKCQGRERVFINLAPVTEPSGTWEENSFPTPQGNQRGKTPTHSKLGHPAEAKEGASKCPSKFRNFSQTSSPAHLTSLPVAGPGCSSESQGHRWKPGSQPTLCPFLFPSHQVPGPAGLYPTWDSTQRWEGIWGQRWEFKCWCWLLTLTSLRS